MGASSTLERLAQEAVAIFGRPESIPPAVRRRAAIQHLSAAGAARQVLAAHPEAASDLAQGDVPTLAGRSASLEDAVALHTGLAGWLELDDHLLRGRSCAATVAAAWAGTNVSHSVDQLLAATVLGNELAGRIGLAASLGAPEWGCPPATAASVALVLGLLKGRNAAQIAGAMAAALAGQSQSITDRTGTTAISTGEAIAAVAGVRAADAAGDVSVLNRGGLLEQWSWRPLYGALEGLGGVWLTHTLTTRTHAVAPAGQTAVEAVAEILARHVKAADKRLRVDQVERIVVRVPAAAAGLGVRGALEPSSIPWSVPNALGILVARHSLGPADLTRDSLSKHADAIAHVAERVEWVVDRGMSARALAPQVRVLGPLVADFRWSDARKVLQRGLSGERRPGRPSRRQLAVWTELVQTIWRTRGPAPGLSAVATDAWQLHLPVEVELFTTRGGRWPERRSLPAGGPGADHASMLRGVLGRFEGIPGCTLQTDRILGPSGTTSALAEIRHIMGNDDC